MSEQWRKLLPELPLFLMIAVATHLVMSFAQTLMHYKLGHHSMGGKFFHNHINFHHTYYSKDHLVSRTYLGDEGNNTPFFFVPVFLVGACTYFVLPVDLFVVQVVACAVSFYAHVFFDKEYHVEGSRLQRFAWFRRKQELHFVHHRHANSNFAVIHFFWDRIEAPIERRMLDRLRRMELFGPVVRADFRHSRRTLPSDFQARMVHVIEGLAGFYGKRRSSITEAMLSTLR